VAELLKQSDAQGKKLATLSIDTEVRFRSAGDRAAFTRELTAAVTSLLSRYHDASAPDGRAFRLVLVAHPRPDDGDPDQHPPAGPGEPADPDAETQEQP
jgi:hypothetical protein